MSSASGNSLYEFHLFQRQDVIDKIKILGAVDEAVLKKVKTTQKFPLL
jgi:hypothetical protein